jgi:hypothetical protein
MRFISTKIHGILDYLTGVLLIILPWVSGFAGGGPAQMVLVSVGILIIAMALLTNYEYGLYKKLPMEVHLVIDAMMGLFLIMSPWLFDFAYVAIGPHLLFGILGIGAALFSKVRPAGYQADENLAGSGI